MSKVCEKLNFLPESSGVYIMLDIHRNIIYIGKAKNLKNRVKQYFNSSAKNPKTESLIEKIVDFEYILTPSEIEALVLENSLIKLHKPYYNILLKDDKTYPYIKINTHQKFPSIEVVRKIKKDGKYYGPYMLGISAQSLLALIHEIFPIRSCIKQIDKGNSRPCLEYHLGRCKAPCMLQMSLDEYSNIVNDVITFISGDDKKARSILDEKLKNAVVNEQFELAIRYRDYLLLLDKLKRKQTINIPIDINADIFTYVSNGIFGTINYMLIRAGRLSGFANIGVSEIGDRDDILSSYIMQYYDYNPLIMGELYLQKTIDFSKDLESYLTEKAQHKISVIMPKRGLKKDLVEMSLKNAAEYLEKNVMQIQNREAMTIGATEKLAEIIGVEGFLRRIECFDVSNISGTNKVSSMVVFINGEPERKLYRMFKIKTVEGSNDYASLRETLQRRLLEFEKGAEDSFRERPDLIIVDGGKGQISAIKDLIDRYSIPLIGIAEQNEEILIPGVLDCIKLSKDNVALKIVQRIRDEAHRFALSYHRKLRSLEMLKSDIKEIPGIGDKKASALFDSFKTKNKIASASKDELMQVKNIGEKDAESIIQYFLKETVKE